MIRQSNSALLPSNTWALRGRRVNRGAASRRSEKIGHNRLSSRNENSKDQYPRSYCRYCNLVVGSCAVNSIDPYGRVQSLDQDIRPRATEMSDCSRCPREWHTYRSRIRWRKLSNRLDGIRESKSERSSRNQGWSSASCTVIRALRQRKDIFILRSIRIESIYFRFFSRSFLIKSFPSSEISPNTSLGKRTSPLRMFSMVSLSSCPPNGDKPLKLEVSEMRGWSPTSFSRWLTWHNSKHPLPTCRCRNQQHHDRRFQERRIPRSLRSLSPLRSDRVSWPDRNRRSWCWYYFSFHTWCSPARNVKSKQILRVTFVLTFKSRWTILFSCMCCKPWQICLMYLIASASVIL